MFIEVYYLTQQWFEKTVDVLEKTRIPFVHFEGNSRITVFFKKKTTTNISKSETFYVSFFFQFIKT